MKQKSLIFLIFISFSFMSCSGVGKKLKKIVKEKPSLSQSKTVKKSVEVSFNKNKNYYPGVKRNYRRMTQEKLEKEAGLNDQAGSLWNMDGQGPYLFSQNIMRMIGDPIGIKVEGEPKKQLESKVQVIRKLMVKLKNHRKVRERIPASKKEHSTMSTANAKVVKSQAKTTLNVKSNAKLSVEDRFDVSTIPTRITERLTDGSYRVKGSQPLMIGQREFKIIVTGIIRAEDFSDEGISANKLIDPRFDIVSLRKGRLL